MVQCDNGIGLIGGGQMAEALIRGMITAEVLPAERIVVIDPDAARRQYLTDTYGVLSTDDAQQVCRECTALIVAVKPQVCGSALTQYAPFISPQHLILSIVAGIPLRGLEAMLPDGCRIIRVMPNTPALVLAGASAISLNQAASDSDRDLALKIFSAVGLCLEVDESQLDAVTGLSGSGPGYMFTLIDALVDGGVLAGLPRPIAQQLAIQTVFGSAKLALESEENVSALKAMVTSPGGTTIHGIQVLEERAVRSAIMDAVYAAAQRSEELGK